MAGAIREQGYLPFVVVDRVDQSGGKYARATLQPGMLFGSVRCVPSMIVALLWWAYVASVWATPVKALG